MLILVFSIQDFPFEIEVSSVGFGLQTITVNSADQEINVQLKVGQNLEEIIVSASRKPQKVQDAPASVSIISSRDIENASSSVVDPVRILQNIPGVTLQQQSANSLGIEMRAGSGLFGTSSFALLVNSLASTELGILSKTSSVADNIDTFGFDIPIRFAKSIEFFSICILVSNFGKTFNAPSVIMNGLSFFSKVICQTWLNLFFPIKFKSLFKTAFINTSVWICPFTIIFTFPSLANLAAIGAVLFSMGS